MTIEIYKPIYWGSGENAKKQRCVGVAIYRVKNEGEIVQIMIKDTYKQGINKGRFIYPTMFCIPKSAIEHYPVELVGHEHKVPCYIVPIEDLQLKKFDLNEEAYYEAIKEADKPKIEKPKEKPQIQQGVLL